MENVQIERRLDVNSVPLLDIGSTSLTGLQVNARPFKANLKLTNPIFQTVALDREESASLNSDFVRAGLLYDSSLITGGSFRDALGAEWSNENGYFMPVAHPLERAGLPEIKAYPRPEWNLPIQQVSAGGEGGKIVIADAPGSGLLSTCFLLRGTWRFLEDISEGSRSAGALLEWAAEEISAGYAYLFSALPKQPDVVVYADDLGFQKNLYISPGDFRRYLLPYLRILLERLRKLTPAAVCFHSCGAIRPILKDIADLGFEILNLDTYAQGMEVRGLRSKLPGSMILHGVNDLCALGESLARGDKAGIAYFITELAQTSPVIAGPTDSLSSREEVEAAQAGAAFIKSFSAEEFAALRRLGPVRSVIENALRKTRQAE